MLEGILEWLSQNLTWVAMGIMTLVFYGGLRGRHKKHNTAKIVLTKTVASGMTEPMTLHPIIDPSKCVGCGTCTQVCPEGDILNLVNHKAVLVGPSKCVGHGECERACPMGAIDLVFGTKKRGVDIPRLNSDYETNVPGLYISGELGGMGLIRNAVKQGQLAARDAISKLSSNGSTNVDIFIVGAGPAGLAASLVATEKKKSYICIDQNTWGGTVNNFPRQKIVMTHPAVLPIVGKMKFAKNKVSKEDLLDYWNAVRKKTRLEIKSKTKFEQLSGHDGAFSVVTDQGKFTAKKVILCMGVRGSPRKLGLANEDLPKVAYNLIDPAQYQRKQIIVVGGGNAAVESAQYLAKEKYGNKIKLLVRGELLDRCNEENKEIITRMEKKGLVQICYSTVIKEIHKDRVVLDHKSQLSEIPNDYIFIFAGAIMPFDFLMSLGVKIDKAFGEKLLKKPA